MIQVRQPISFIETADPKCAHEFYGSVLDLVLMEKSPFALVYSDGGVMLRVQIVEYHHPAPHTVHGWQVANIENEMEQLMKRGISFLTFEHLPQTSLGVRETPDGNKVAWFQDPSGNLLSLTEFFVLA